MPGVSETQPPLHVRATFGVPDADVVADGRRWRCNEVILSRADDHARATFSASVRENLQVDGVRVARPIRSSDGRWVASGWVADTYVIGKPEPRYDEVVGVADRLHAATASLPRPALLTPRPGVAPSGVLEVADQVAWGAEHEPFTASAHPLEPDSVTLFRELARFRRPVHAPDQLVHGDLFGTVLFAGAAAPGVVDITPFWRPAAWAAAIVVVDALAWGDADDGLVQRWSEHAEWPQQLLRAVLFRLAVHTLHPRATTEAYPGLQRAAELVRTRL